MTHAAGDPLRYGGTMWLTSGDAFRRISVQNMVVKSRTDSPQSPWLESLDQRAVAAWVARKGRHPEAPVWGLDRHRLLEKRLQDNQVVWLNAPAGYGKTVLMGDYVRYAEQNGTSVIWLTLDNRDTPAEYFLLHFLEAAEYQLPGIATDALAHWHETRRRGRVDTEQVLLLWLQELAGFGRALLLCFDDVHNLHESDSFQVLNLIIEQLPAGVGMLLASRYTPAHLGRLRLNPRLSWLGSQDLAFTDDETQKLLLQHDVPEPARQVPSLMQRLQGWPAGLAIWLACYRAAGRPPEPPPGLAQQELSDYLLGETLHRVEPGLQQFVQQAAVLGTFSENLLQHCTGSADYHTPLLQALRLNLFIEPLEHRSGWFRMHPVMGALLAHQLPGGQRRGLHESAYAWLSHHQQPVAALYHARQAGLGGEILSWVEHEAELILANLDIAGLLDWFDILGDELLYRSARLMAIAAWVWLLTHQTEKAALLIRHLQAQGALAEYEENALLGYMARLKGQLDDAGQYCRQALEQIPGERFTLRILMSSTLAHLCLAEQDPEGARIWNRLAQDLSRQHQVPAMEALALFDYARIELNRGHLQHSATLVDHGLALLQTEEGQAERLPRGRLLLYRAMQMWLSSDDLPRLEETLQQGINAAISVHDVSVCYGYAVSAIRLSARGEHEAALETIGIAERLMQRWQVEADSYQWLNMIKANVWITQGKLRRAQSCIDQLLNGRRYAQLPRPELFPMLPSFVILTQGRLWLLANQVAECLALVDEGMRSHGGNFATLLMQLLRAEAMRRQQGGSDSQKLINQTMQMLRAAGIGSHFLAWVPFMAGADGDSGRQDAELDDIRVSLSERELEVLSKIAQGLSNQEIADQLFISLHTVKTHARKINVKLGARSRTQAIHRAQELNLL